MSSKAWLVLVAAGLFLSSCTLNVPKGKIRLNVRSTERTPTSFGPEPRLPGPPSSLSQMDCFFVSITGNDVTPTHLPANSGLTNAAGSCPALGALSPLLSYNDLVSQGATVEVLSGNNRTIQVFGVYTPNGTACTGKSSVTEFTGLTTRPAFYEVGQTVSDLKSATSLNITSSYHPASATDLIEQCTGVAPLVLTASPVTVAVGSTTTMTVTGGVPPYTFTIVSGSGSINQAAQTFTPSQTGTVVLSVTDSLGFSAESSVTAIPALSIIPATKSMAVGTNFTFSSSGGIGTVTYSLVSGSGTLNPTTGDFTAPASTQTVVIRATDSAATPNTSDATVLIVPALAVVPLFKTMAVNTGFTFSATGGVGTVTYSIVSGGGSIVGSSGVFTAPSTSQTVIVRATDSQTPTANTSDSSVTVTDALAISPASKTLAVTNTFTFSASNGVSPYTFSVVSGSGTINPSTGFYTAPASAQSVTVRVTDSQAPTANTSDSTVTVNAALSLSPATMTLAVNNTTSFTAANGVPSYTYSVDGGGAGGSINASGLYTAPATVGSGSDTVRVTDSFGNTTTSTVTINPALGISPATWSLAVNNTKTFTGTNGVPPYTYSVVGGGAGGTINASGDYTAPASVGSGSDTVRVTDSLGNMANAAITISGPLAITPTTWTLAVNNTKTFAGTGGVAPYTYSIDGGGAGGTINATSGDYTAPSSVGSGTDTVRITDSVANTVTAIVTIHPALGITPTTWSLAVNNTKSFSGSGGVTPYTYSVDGGGAGGTIDSAGLYTAPATVGSGSDTVRVTDNVGNTITASVTVNAALGINPTAWTLAVNNTKTFSGTGGVTPYTYSVDGGGAGGTINPTSGVYTAPATVGSGSDVVRVTDNVGNTVTASITINSALGITPPSWVLAVNNTKSFAGTNGVSPYTYSVDGGGAGGSIDSAGLYTAPATVGSGSDTVRVTDNVGNTVTASVTVNAALGITPPSWTLAVNNTKAFSATNGVPPYTYSVDGGGAGGSIDSGGLYTAPASSGSDIVRVTDNVGNTVTASVTINAALGISPTSWTLAVNNTKAFSGTNGVSPYTYSVDGGGAGGTIDSAGTYTAPAIVGSDVVRVTDNVGNTVTASVTINSALGISPTSWTLAVNNTKGFSGSGGVSPYTYSVDGGGAGGTIDVSGVYTAPATVGSGSDTVRVTDDVGNSVTATVTINPAVGITPASWTLAVNNTKSFSGTGGVTPYTYSVDGGGAGGTINASGLYTAPTTVGSGSDTVRVTDNLGNTTTATVTINAALAVNPTFWVLAVNNTKSFVPSNGVSPYTYSVDGGGAGGTIDASGTYTAPSIVGSGTDTVRITDNVGNEVTASVVINAALSVAPPTWSLAVNNTKVFAGSHGVSPYTYSVDGGGAGGTINAGGTYTAPATVGSGSDTVRVTDNVGNEVTAAVLIFPALGISPTSKTLAVNNTQTFSGSGGVTPYTYSVDGGGAGGTISSGSGLYTAPTSVGTGSDIVRVTDNVGNTVTAVVTINSALSVSPASWSLAVNNTKTFTGNGGVAPYTYSVDGGGAYGTINASGLYTAPTSVGSGSDTVRVTDNLGNEATAVVTVNPALSMLPAAWTLAVNNTKTFAGSGGATPYTYSVDGGGAGGTINGTSGVYTAPTSVGSGTDTVRVTDNVGNTLTSTVTINPALGISPTNWTLVVNDTKTFSGSGGVTPYTYSVEGEGAGGSIDSGGVYTAPGSSGSDVVRVTDAVGNTVTASVTVSAPPAVTGVSSTAAAGTYVNGQSISIQVDFNGSVNVTGTPKLQLETGTTDNYATYVSGSGGTSLTFTYVVTQGDSTADLDYTSTSSLSLNGGSIKDAVNNNATLTLATPGTANSLGANEAIVLAGNDLTLYYTDTDSENNDMVGNAVAGIGDIDGDGKSDFAVAQWLDDAAYTDQGAVNIHMTGTLGTPAQRFGNQFTNQFGSAIAAGGFINGDGVPDYVIAEKYYDASGTDSGRVQVYSGYDNTQIRYYPAAGESGAEFGSAIANIGDVNGDGRDDLAVGAPKADGGGTDRGKVFIYSGSDGTELDSIFGLEDNALFGSAIAGIGDINADGKPDFIVGEPFADGAGTNRGKAYIVDGTNGNTLFTIVGLNDNDELGTSVAGLGDVDADGKPDVLIGIPGAASGGTNRGVATIYKGSDQSIYLAVSGLNDNDRFGTVVANAGDINGDGRHDAIVGAPNADPGGADSGMVVVFDGKTGGILYTVLGTEAGGQLGASVAGAGDVNGDGKADILIGEPFANGSGVDVGKAYVYTSNFSFNFANSPTFSYANPGTASSSEMGRSVALTADVNNDGVPDLIVGEPGAAGGGTARGEAHVISGSDGIVLHTFNGTENNGAFGHSVADAGDVNGDGKTDFIVGEPLVDDGTTDEGNVHIFSGADGSTLRTIYGTYANGKLGTSVAGLGDMTGDGLSEVAIGEPGRSGGFGGVIIYDVMANSSVYSILGSDSGGAFGTAVARAGDINRDGKADFIVSAPLANGSGTLRGKVFAYNGNTGTYFTTFPGGEDNAGFGTSLAGGGDVNGDGTLDIIIGSPTAAGGGTARGKVYAYNGVTWANIFTTPGGENNGNLGRSVAIAGDVNHDGKCDVLAGEPYGGASDEGKAYVLSGNTGSVLHTLQGTENMELFGWSVGGARDINRDGNMDFIVGAPWGDPGVTTNGGRSKLYLSPNQ